MNTFLIVFGFAGWIIAGYAAWFCYLRIRSIDDEAKYSLKKAQRDAEHWQRLYKEYKQKNIMAEHDVEKIMGGEYYD